MNLRTLGKTGYQVSEIGLGCWQLGGDFGPVTDDAARDILKTARSLDVNFWGYRRVSTIIAGGPAGSDALECGFGEA